MPDLTERLRAAAPGMHLLTGEQITDDWTHDESLTATPERPEVVVLPTTAEEVAAVLVVADELRVPVTPRGSGTGLSGGCVPGRGGIVLSTTRMDRILEIDTENQVAVVQPGVTLAQLDEATRGHGLVYPVFPGENSASLGGNVATNAGGMRAVKYGVTRHQVLGIQAALPSGEIIRSGGKLVKVSSGYDLTQLILGSEGTLAVVTEVTVRLYPRPAHSATVLVPFTSLADVAGAVPKVVATGMRPLMLEYLDALALSATAGNVGLDLGIAPEVQEKALAYLVVVLEDDRQDRLDEDVQRLGELLTALGALDVYVLPPGAGAQLLEAREKAFWVVKAMGADDIVDVCVPRASMPSYLEQVGALGQQFEALVAGAGHAGDGNIHLSVFQPDPQKRAALMQGIFEAGLAHGGVISGEHGIGTAKKHAFLELEDPVRLRLMQGIKQAFDPHGILNPAALLPVPEEAR